MVATDNEIDVFNQLYRLRQQRANMVDNPEQYKLVHLVLLDMLFTPQAGISCDDKMEKAIQRFTQKSMLNAHMQYLEKTLWYDSAAKTLAREKSVLYQDYFPEKNRFPNIVPGKKIACAYNYFSYSKNIIKSMRIYCMYYNEINSDTNASQ